jgi:pyruvate,orthophosphate dikinase
VPHENAAREELASELEVDLSEFNRRADDLHETNPMMGHRGVRLGISFPEITETQVRAILEAAVELTQEGKETHPEIMIPVLGHVNELQNQKQIVDRVYQEVLDKYSIDKIDYMVGTMIEIPRAALTADQIAEVAEFFSFGTNDLTQMSFGFSRDDVGGFLPDYISEGVLENDPFQTVDQEGVGQLIELGIERGRATRSDLKIGICGEHGGDAVSVVYCHNINMDYVSCSPFRVPIARLAAAHAVIQDEA